MWSALGIICGPPYAKVGGPEAGIGGFMACLCGSSWGRGELGEEGEAMPVIGARGAEPRGSSAPVAPGSSRHRERGSAGQERDPAPDRPEDHGVNPDAVDRDIEEAGALPREHRLSGRGRAV